MGIHLLTFSVSALANFGRDSSPVYQNEIKCDGSELSLKNCSITEANIFKCHQSAGVICEGKIVHQWPHDNA